jgi:hypothetical protein
MHLRKRACGCGSGRPARDCCGRFRRLTRDEIATAYLHRQARHARDLIGPFAAPAIAALQAEAASLPSRCEVFTGALRSAVPSALRELQNSAMTPERLWARAAAADTVVARAAVSKAIVTLREAGEIDEHLAAAAIIELASGRSRLCEAALVEAAGSHHAPAVTSGRTPRPATV